MDGVDAKALQIVDGARLGKSQILATVLKARSGADGEVAHVELVNHEVGRRRDRRTPVIGPAHGVGVSHIDDGTTAAVDTYSLGKRARALASADVESIEHAAEVALYRSLPTVVADGAHLDGLDGSTALSVLIDTHLGEGGRIEAEHGLGLVVSHLVKASLRVGSDRNHCGKKCR